MRPAETAEYNSAGRTDREVYVPSLIPPGAFEQGLPPRLVMQVPVDGVGQTLFELAPRLPFQFAFREGGIDGVTAVMAEAVGDKG